MYDYQLKIFSSKNGHIKDVIFSSHFLTHLFVMANRYSSLTLRKFYRRSNTFMEDDVKYG